MSHLLKQNLRHISAHSIRPDAPAETRNPVTLSHGLLTIPKLISLLGSPEIEICQRSLVSLHALLADAKEQVQAVREGLIPKVVALFTDDEHSVRSAYGE